MARSYRDLLVWQKAKALALHVYNVTQAFPKSEIFGITSQMRRAAVSVVSNVAEGQGRLTRGEFRYFLGTARGSILELETQLSIAHDLGYVSNTNTQAIESETYQVLGLINRLIEALASKNNIETLKPSKP